MAHVRAQIRAKLVAVLSGLATTGANVYANRKELVPASNLPAVFIMNDNDEIKARAIGSQAAPHARNEMSTVMMKIQAAAKATAGLDDTLDEICLEVQKAISADIFLGGLTVDARLMSTVFELDALGETQAGLADMIWEFDFWSANNAPDVVS